MVRQLTCARSIRLATGLLKLAAHGAAIVAICALGVALALTLAPGGSHG